MEIDITTDIDVDNSECALCEKENIDLTVVMKSKNELKRLRTLCGEHSEKLSDWWYAEHNQVGLEEKVQVLDKDNGIDVMEELTKESISWPLYYSSGDTDDAPEHWVPAFYRVEGPNGPVWYVNPEENPEPQPYTMHDFAMEAQSESFQHCLKEDTPWTEVDDKFFEDN